MPSGIMTARSRRASAMSRVVYEVIADTPGEAAQGERVARLGQVAVPPVLVSESVSDLAVDRLGRGQTPQSKTSFGEPGQHFAWGPPA